MKSFLLTLFGVSSAIKFHHHHRPVGVTFFEQGVEDDEVIGGNLNLVREGFHYGEYPVQDPMEGDEEEEV